MVFYLAAAVVSLLVAFLRVVGATVYPVVSRTNRLNSYSGLGTAQPFAFLADATSASPTLTNISDTSPITVGDAINGPSLYVPSAVVSKTSNTVTLDGNATGNTSQLYYVDRDVPNATFQLNGAQLRLFKSAFAPTVNSVLADLTVIEADYAGYAPVTLVMTTGLITAGGLPINQSQLCHFASTDAVTPNNVFGGWIDNGSEVLLAFTLDPQIALNRLGAVLELVVQDSYPPGALVLQVYP